MMKQEMIIIVQSIPFGRVASYGAVAQEIDKQFSIHTSWWLVGRMLSTLEDHTSLPWWRVVNKQGVISALKLGERGLEQIQHLESEGVVVTNGQVDMRDYEYSFFWY